MAEFTIGEVERLTGLKAHVLRYWEEAIPLIRPRKDDQGRRFYRERDIELIQRVRYLVQERKYSLEGAGERLLSELTDERLAEPRARIDEARAELINLYALVRKWEER
ncbi:MAG TPA: MerR family transcriptional regulator [Treponemataceae bacterium]|jgi:DNA-binding transcriptional MerR regulator|nr:MerR family transcriptional regulator [Treponemataceae bacterium]